MKLTTGSVLWGVAVAAVIAAVVAGLFVLGSPWEERARRLDERRVADLQRIAAATDLYWTRHARLAASLEDLTTEPGVTISTDDPTTADPYGYQPLDSANYELCARFEMESRETFRYRGRPADNIWVHGAGRQCFRLEAEEIERTRMPGALRDLLDSPARPPA